MKPRHNCLGFFSFRGMNKYLFVLLIGIYSTAYSQEVIVLGIAQDGGFPHIGCQKECLRAHQDKSLAKFVTSLALIDPESNKWWLFEATPDIDDQLQYFREITGAKYPYLPEGIFITHAHIGHYTGLMSLGKEALGAKGVKVYALPRMIDFLKTNGPWSQLVLLENITPIPLNTETQLKLNNRISISATQVPHRDEFSETAGFRITTSSKQYLFIPDIDKWQKWSENIVEIIRDPDLDYAFIDATFFDDNELPYRAMSEIPHPFAIETMELFQNESLEVKKKIQFIHLNHTNPLLFDVGIQKSVIEKGFGIASQGETY